ncbi:YidC/Oxa1 family membrane protein insertase [Colletotrichum graminicola M1.001]|uniref:YidC/Oxa1 family membrane protein insertase n=1 Tax=Colletotrichum graminicola (strain M1.001 / M2 / FGSC 10212) TaxID=645133 RepID=E3QXM1_COLGM|nr:YidC/Oxa1 family membrane protein insertase [Colletotrichum graminicola M1.001]EFQ35609.1 YidC/Oxa1 family membrane protein insertase [Colletotrichum graminicola M1.001]
MLPSRGVLRSLPSMSRSPRRLGDGRQFGTSLRSSGAPWTALRPANSRLSGGLAGTVAIGGSLETRRALSLWYSKPAETTPTPTTAAPAQTPVEPAAAINDASASVPVSEPVLADAADLATPSSSIPDLDAAALLDLPEQIGFLKTLGLDFGWGPSSVMQWAFEHIHVYSGLPWWGSIAATGILLRLVMFKPLLMAQETSARMQKLQQNPKYEEVRKGVQEAMSRGDTAAMTEMRRDLSVMNKNAGVNPLKGLWGLLQIPFGYGMFRVLNGAAAIPVPGMETGGFLWVSDLTVSDPLFLLPIAGPLAMFAMVKLGSRYATPQAKAQQKLMMYILGPISVIFTAYLPAGVQWYFFVAGAVGVFQNWLFNMAGFRKFFGLMPLSTPTTATTTTAAASSGLTYQAPRGAAAATPAETSAQDGSISGVINSLKQTVHDAKGGAGNYMEANRTKEEANYAKKYAERRGEQERQKFWSEMRKK